jgi:hypothetical protein
MQPEEYLGKEMTRASIVDSFSQIYEALWIGISLMFVSIPIASCDPLRPSAMENSDELGTSVIGEYLKSGGRWNLQREDNIRLGIRDLLANPTSRSDVEAIGMHCESAPSTICSYVGKVVFRLYGLPQHSVHEGKQFVTTIFIKLSYADLNSLTVRKEEVETLAE